MGFLKIFLVILLASCVHSKFSFHASDIPALHSIFNFFGNGNKSVVPKLTMEQLGRSVGQCQYEFYWQEHFRHQCDKDDRYILHLLALRRLEVMAAAPPIMVRCLEPLQTPNASFVENSVRMLGSVEEILEFIKPIGNATKRYEKGNCVVMLFYTPSCLGCAHIAPHMNILPKMFPSLRIGAIDAIRFHSFNAEFGIVGLPTVLLFHQGRPVVKFYSDVRSLSTFVTRHTGIKPIVPVPRASDLSGPLPLQPTRKTDYILVLSWAFVLICAAYYFIRSKYFKKICDVVKSIWQESEAQLEQ